MPNSSYGFDVSVPNLPGFVRAHAQKIAPIAYKYPPSKEIIKLIKEALTFQAYAVIAANQLAQSNKQISEIQENINKLKAKSDIAMKHANSLLSQAPHQFKEPIMRMGELTFMQSQLNAVNAILSVEKSLIFYGIRRDPKGFVAYEKKTYHPSSTSTIRPTVANGQISSVPADPTYTNIWDQDSISTSQSSTLPQGEATGDEIAFQTLPSTAVPSASDSAPLPTLSDGPALHQTFEIFADQGLTPASYDEGTVDASIVEDILTEAEAGDYELDGQMPPPGSYPPPRPTFRQAPTSVQVPLMERPAVLGLTALLLIGGGYYLYQRNQ